MKIRSDFVSNSSSCSFTVENVSKLMDFMIPLGELPWSYDEFSISFTCKHKDYAKIYKALTGEEYHESRSWYGPDEYRLKPEDDEYYSVDYNQLINNWNKIPEEIRKTITHFSMSCDDYNSTHVALLNMIYDVLELADIQPSDEYTEIEYRPGKAKYDNFLTNLGMKLKELKDSKKCQKPSKTK